MNLSSARRSLSAIRYAATYCKSFVDTTAPTSADSGSEFQPSRGVVTCQDPSDVPPGASSYGRVRGIREGLAWPRCRTGPVGSGSVRRQHNKRLKLTARVD